MDWKTKKIVDLLESQEAKVCEAHKKIKALHQDVEKLTGHFQDWFTEKIRRGICNAEIEANGAKHELRMLIEALRMEVDPNKDERFK